MIELRNVTLRYHYEEYDLFSDLSLVLPDGVNTVLCDLQSGKTSLCKLILGQLPPNSGNVLLDGVDLYNCGKVKPEISALYLPNEPTFFPNKTVKFNLEYPLRVRKQLRENADKVLQLAQQYGLENLLPVKVKNLNFRQKKLLAIARGLVVARDIVLFDGFFDDTEQEDVLSRDEVLNAFNCKTKVIFTTDLSVAIGNTVVVDDKKCIYSGESDGARAIMENLMWLAAQQEKQ